MYDSDERSFKQNERKTNGRHQASKQAAVDINKSSYIQILSIFFCRQKINK